MVVGTACWGPGIRPFVHEGRGLEGVDAGVVIWREAAWRCRGIPPLGGLQVLGGVEGSPSVWDGVLGIVPCARVGCFLHVRFCCLALHGMNARCRGEPESGALCTLAIWCCVMPGRGGGRGGHAGRLERRDA